MTEYKNYTETRLDDQIELVTEVTKDWINWGYPDKEGLKQAYAREGFTPETRHYAYDGDRLVGFISSAMEEVVDEIQFASIQVPFIREGYKHLEENLMQKTIETLRSKGAKAIRTDVRDTWGSMMQIAKKYGYDEGRIRAHSMQIDLESITKEDGYKRHEHVVEVDVDKDKKMIIPAFQTEMTQSPEEIANLIDNWKQAENILANVIVKDNELLSHSMIFRNPQNPENGFMTGISIYKKGYEHLVKDVFECLTHVAKDAGLTLLYHQVAEPRLVEYYTDFGFELTPNYRFIIQLD